jgi:ribosomal protein L7/L12
MTEVPREEAGLPPTAIEALRKGNKVEAIKIVRLERNLGLKEAKDLVEDYVRRDPALKRRLEEAQAETTRGCGLWLVIFLALVAVGYYFLSGK